MTRLVLLPGLDGTGRLFERFARALKSRCEIQIVSYPSDRPLDYRALAELALHEIGAGPFVVLGESFSGPIAVEIADRLPSQVQGLILVGTFLTAPLPPAMLRIGAMMDHRRLPFWLVKYMMLGGADDKELSRVLAELMNELPPATYAARLRAIADVDARAALSRVRCPILGLHGNHDTLVSPRALRKALQDRDEAELRLLPSPHMVLQTQPSLAAEIMVSFLGRTAATRQWTSK